MTKNTQNMFHASRNSLDLAHYSGINNKKHTHIFFFLLFSWKRKHLYYEIIMLMYIASSLNECHSHKYKSTNSALCRERFSQIHTTRFSVRTIFYIRMSKLKRSLWVLLLTWNLNIWNKKVVSAKTFDCLNVFSFRKIQRAATSEEIR